MDNQDGSRRISDFVLHMRNIHIERLRVNIHENRFCSFVKHRICRSHKTEGSCYDMVPRSNFKSSNTEMQPARSTINSDGILSSRKLCHLLLELEESRTQTQIGTLQHCDHSINIFLPDLGTCQRNLEWFHRVSEPDLTSPTILAGTPTAVTFFGMSSMTTAPAPILDHEPTDRP